jgi:hypothetical protein
MGVGGGASGGVEWRGTTLAPSRPAANLGLVTEAVGWSMLGRRQEGLGHFYFYCFFNNFIFFFLVDQIKF